MRKTYGLSKAQFTLPVFTACLYWCHHPRTGGVYQVFSAARYHDWCGASLNEERREWKWRVRESMPETCWWQQETKDEDRLDLSIRYLRTRERHTDNAHQYYSSLVSVGQLTKVTNNPNLLTRAQIVGLPGRHKTASMCMRRTKEPWTHTKDLTCSILGF